jgi:anti-sigma regulatory factor (Ser/Thr protein kinase)
MDYKLSVQVKIEMRYRDPIGEMLRYVCSRLEEQGEPETFGHQVLSAYNEAFNNLVIHGGDANGPKEVSITVSVTDRRLMIRMEDNTAGFQPPEVIPELTEARESGMGLLIMRKLMSTVEYEKRAPDGVNTLTMAKHLTITPKYA